MGTSRLLLSIRTFDSMPGSSPAGAASSERNGQISNFKTIAQYPGISEDGASAYQRSDDNLIRRDQVNDVANGRVVRTQETFLTKRAWWLFGVTYEVATIDTLVEIEQRNDLEGNGIDMNVLKVSRLGRYDHWL